MTQFWRYCSYGVFIKYHVSSDLSYNNYFNDQSWNMEIRTTGIEITTSNRWKMVAIEKNRLGEFYLLNGKQWQLKLNEKKKLRKP